MQLKMKSGNCFSVAVLDGSVGKITESAFYKINIKRYVSTVCDNTIYLKSELSYLSLKRIISCFLKYTASCGFEFVVEPAVSEYISEREMYLYTRSKLGIELKKQDSKLSNQFAEYSALVNSCLERQLREKQLWDSFFMTTMKKSCNFSVPGSGKTSSVYGTFAYLRHQNLVKRLLVICPKNAFAPWIDEFTACFGNKESLSLFNIQDPSLNSRNKKQAAIKYESGAANLLLFNYECLKSLGNDIANLIDNQTILVFDEVHKVKRIDGEYAKAAIAIAKEAKYIIAMTGTPIPNSYQDIYNLLHILFNEEYEDFFGFNAAVLKNCTTENRIAINKKIQPFFCRTTKQQLFVPPANSDSILPIKATDDEITIFRALLKKHKKNKLLLMLRILQLESDPHLLLSSIDLSDYQYILEDDSPVDEIDYADYSTEILDCIDRISLSSKTRQCLNLVNGVVLQNKPIIIWCIYVKTIQNLTSLLEAQGIKVKAVYGEIPLEKRQSTLEAFKNREFEVLITNPNTLAESISLHTVCHDAIYFEYSFNLVHLLQSKDRIHRLGLVPGQYTQFYFLQALYSVEDGYYSMDEQIYERLCDKEHIMLNAIDADMLEQMPTTDEELDLIFSQLKL